MSETFVIRLLPERDTEEVAQWLLVDQGGARMGVVLTGSVTDAAPLAVGRKVVVIVPGTDALLAEPLLPIKRAVQLEQLVRYALEEQLASDIDDLHFALGKRTASGATPVVALEHERMQRWQAQLTGAGIVADVMYVDTDLVPSATGGIAIVDGGLLWTRQGSSRATVLDVQPLADALQLALPDSKDNEQVSAGDVTLYIAQADYEHDIVAINACRTRLPNLQVKLLPEGPLPLFALHAVTANEATLAVNLLTGKYARKKSWDKALAPWRIAATLCGVAVALYLATTGVRYWQLARAEKQLDRELTELLGQTLPASPNKDPRTARRQFETQLAASRGSGDGGGLLHGLNVLGNTVEQVPETRIDALAYRTKTIDLRVTAPSVDALDRIQHLATEQGLTAEIQSATPRDKKVEGRLQFKAPG